MDFLQNKQYGGKEMKKANIYYRKDGRWEGRISKGRDNNGKRRYHAFFGRSRDEVERKIEVYQNKIPNAISNVQLSQVITEWFQSIQFRIKESTLANYMLKANKHILPAFGNMTISQIMPTDIYKFIQQKHERKLSNRYISDILIIIKSIFKFAVSRYHIYNPMDEVTMPKKQKSEVKLLTTDEQRRLEQYIVENHNLTTLGVALSNVTGLRIGELCALQWKDIDLEKRILTVSKTIQRIQIKNGRCRTKLIITAPKTENSHRTIPIPKFMIAFLREFQGDADAYILSGSYKPLEPRTLQYRFVRILKNANLPSVHFHALRHMFASNCVKLGFDIKALSEILGHSGVEITLNRYVHSSLEQKFKYMERVKMSI